MNTAYQSLCARLMMAGVPDARFDAAQLYTFVTGRDHRRDDGPTAEEASRLQVLAEQHVMDLVPLFSDAGHHHIPVVNEEQQLVGIITQSDLVKTLAAAVTQT